MQINFASAEWQEIYDNSVKEIQEHAQALIGYNCDARKADYLRGQIESLRKLIEHDKARYKDFSIKLFS